MTFNDIFKNSFLNNITAVGFGDMLIAFALAFAVGLFIMWVYRKTFSGVLYSHSFALSLLLMSLITTMIILTISSNIILSLGMVGALSIVRFRAAIKDPMDIVFLFWSISAGIVFGAGLISLGVLGSLIIGLSLLLFSLHKVVDTPYALIMTCENEVAEQEAMRLINSTVRRSQLKAKTLRQNGSEITMEVHLKDDGAAFINQINTIPDVSNVVLVSYNGNYMG